eukprot:1161740-Pelagomonas_calceolata.AAC.11
MQASKILLVDHLQEQRQRSKTLPPLQLDGQRPVPQACNIACNIPIAMYHLASVFAHHPIPLLPKRKHCPLMKERAKKELTMTMPQRSSLLPSCTSRLPVMPLHLLAFNRPGAALSQSQHLTSAAALEFQIN